MLVASTKEKLASHLPTTYKTKLQFMKSFECLKKKCCTPALDFNFVDVNILPPHSTIALQNNTFWVVTHHTIHTKNKSFFIRYDREHLCRPWMDGDGHK